MSLLEAVDYEHPRVKWINRSSGIKTYVTAHRKVRRWYGRPSEYLCASGCGKPAGDWSYDGLDPHEMVGTGRLGTFMKFSPDPRHYQPRCRACHHEYDKALRRS